MRLFRHIIPALLLIPLCATAQDVATDSIAVYTQTLHSAIEDADYSKATSAVTQLIRLRPDHGLYRYELAQVLQLAGQPETAVQLLQTLLDNGFERIIYALQDPAFAALREQKTYTPLFNAIATLTAPVRQGSPAFTVNDKALIPEGIAHDPLSGDFFLSSLHQCKILRVQSDGTARNFTAPFQDGLVPVIGLHVDAKRRHLWAASSYGYKKAHLPDSLWGRSGLYCYDMDTGRLLRKAMLNPADGRFLNDMIIAGDGTVYATDSRGRALFKLAPGRNTLEKITDLNFTPNGIDLSGDETRLYLGGNDIAVMDLATAEIRPLKRQLGIHLNADGLCFYNNSLIAVQNGLLNSIRRLYLNAAGDTVLRIEPLEAHLPEFEVPTTGVLVKNTYYYIANSQLRKYDDKGALLPLTQLNPVYIRKIPLK